MFAYYRSDGFHQYEQPQPQLPEQDFQPSIDKNPENVYQETETDKNLDARVEKDIQDAGVKNIMIQHC